MSADRTPVSTIVLGLAAIGFVGAGLASAQTRTTTAPSTTRVLSRIIAAYEEPFGRVSEVRELTDGRLLILDGESHELRVLDPRTGRSSKLGRSGRGPGEYVAPAGIHRTAGDTLLITDLYSPNVVIISPDGQILGSRRQPGARPIQGADSHGFLYRAEFQAARPSGAGLARLLRYSWTGATASEVALPAPRSAGTGPGGGSNHPFAPRPLWSVTSRGAVVVLTAEPYQLTLHYPGGERAEGRPVGYTPIPVTPEHLGQLNRELHRPRATLFFDGNGAPAEVRPARMRLPEFTGPTPRTLPPFLSGAIFAHPQGQIWVQRTGPTMTAPLFDVFGEDANRAYQVSLSTPGHRLVGLGKACAYVVAQSPEGGERLSCFAYP